MIVAELKGGLGNQMFQYTAARLLAERHGVPLQLDLRWYRRGGSRAYCLNAYGIDEGSAWQGLQAKLWHRLGRLTVVAEQGFSFAPCFEGLPNNVWLKGYWQSRHYVELAGAAVRRWFALPRSRQQRLLVSCPLVQGSASVGVHLRRGDYLSDPGAAAHHGVCPPAYYRAACELMTKRVAEPRFLVFTDDPGWAREHFQPGHDFTVVSGDASRSDVEEHFLISRCAHHIIANSSYSWWAAWLATPGGTVVAPRQWFADREIQVDDLLPAHWNKL